MSYVKLDDIDVKVPNENKPSSGVMYGVIVVAFLVAIGIAFYMNKESSTSIDEIRKALDNLRLKSNEQSTDIVSLKNMAKQTDTIIQGHIKDIAKNSADIIANNASALAALNELRAASKFLKDSDSLLQNSINLVGTKLDTFAKIIDQRITSDRTELKLMIENTITTDDVRFKAIEKQIPELKNSIEILKSENAAQVKLLQDSLLENSKSDSTYRDYVDKINTYIENVVPEMSDSFKQKLFGTKDDITLKMYDLKVESYEETPEMKAYASLINMRTQYLAAQYQDIMGCKLILRSNGQQSEGQNFDQVLKRMKETPNNSKLYELAFLFFATILLNEGRQVTMDTTKMELIVKSNRLAEVFNKMLPPLGFPTLFFISKGQPSQTVDAGNGLRKTIPEIPDTYSYPYLTAKKATETFLRKFLNVKECESLLDILGNKDFCQKISDNMDKVEKCTS
jgi:hypothetical protein